MPRIRNPLSARRRAPYSRRARAALVARARRSESGVVIVLFALAVVILLGMVAAGLDGGRLFDERRRAQNAADHAALTAAHARCVRGLTSAGARAAGVASAAANGYPSSAVAWLPQPSGYFKASITTSIPATFAAVLGWTQLGTHATAVAGCTGQTGESPGAVFAGGTTCDDSSKYTFQTSGSGQQVFGGVHANGDVSIGTKPNWWTDDGVDDPFTYVGTMKSGEPVAPTFYASPPLPGEFNVFQQAPSPPGYPQQEDDPREWPTDYAPGDVADRLDAYEALARANLPTVPGAVEGTYFNEKIESDDVTRPGVYYSTQEIEIGSIDDDLNVTFVSEKSIKLSASGTPSNPWSFTPFVDGLLAFSGMPQPDEKKCSDYTVELSGSNVNWNGIIWAPGGLANFSGSEDATLNGTVIAWAVSMGGSDLHIVSDESLFSSPIGEVFLFE